MLRLAIPKGSLEEKTFQLFEKAGLPIRTGGGRNYHFWIDDPRISEVFMLRSQEVASYIASGEFDLGPSGWDWVVETRSAVETVADLEFSRNGWNKVKIVLATSAENPVQNPQEINVGSKVVTEYLHIARRYFRSLEKGKIRIKLSYGATEAKVPRLADYLIDVTDSGETLKRNNKKILDVLLESSTLLIANPLSLRNPVKSQAIKEIAELLMRVVRARDKTLLKMNISINKLDAILNYLPSAKAPSVVPLVKKGWFSVETLLQKSEMNIILPKIKSFGAINVIETDADKYSP
jgi:ATP phosphoribosyltransferase